MAKKGSSVLFIVALATLALAVAAVWKTSHGRSLAQPYVGKWQFVSGEVKAGAGFPLSAKTAPDGTTTKPMAGKSAVVERRDGALWYAGDDRNCRYEMRVADGKAEVLPGGRVECDTKEADNGATPATTMRMSMAVDAQGQAHISGQARVSLDLQGTHRDIDFTYDGVAVRDVAAAR